MVKFTLENIVKEFIRERGETSVHNFERFLMLGIMGVRELHMDITGAPTWDMLSVNANTQIAQLPADCLRLLRAGYLTSDNNLVPLIWDEDMVLNPTASEGQFVDLDNLTKSYDFPAITGVSARQDYLNGILKVASNLPTDYIYVEYIMDKEKLNGKYMVLPYEVEAVKAYIRWADVRSNPNMAQNKIDRYEDYWIRSREHTEARMTSQTVEDIIRQYRQTYTGSPRL